MYINNKYRHFISKNFTVKSNGKHLDEYIRLEKSGIRFYEKGKYLIIYIGDVLLNTDFDVYDLNNNNPSSFLKIPITIINKSQSKITYEVIIPKNLI